MSHVCSAQHNAAEAENIERFTAKTTTPCHSCPATCVTEKQCPRRKHLAKEPIARSKCPTTSTKTKWTNQHCDSGGKSDPGKSVPELATAGSKSAESPASIRRTTCRPDPKAACPGNPKPRLNAISNLVTSGLLANGRIAPLLAERAENCGPWAAWAN